MKKKRKIIISTRPDVKIDLAKLIHDEFNRRLPENINEVQNDKQNNDNEPLLLDVKVQKILKISITDR